MSDAEGAARAARIDRLAELLYMHLAQLPPKARAERMRAIQRIADRVTREALEAAA